ncbi:hypothetical protein [Tahibacter soli]|uniref:Uncharacterized protein n=1 Tax=Tahibacter soli TaxID=2983605 RepID=A0A9X3YHN5_9GAMM|nr:hypothetical protein [Tahibacter soli]MDC8011285.1 hypothetical protein [Tahibacter soli]
MHQSLRVDRYVDSLSIGKLDQAGLAPAFSLRPFEKRAALARRSPKVTVTFVAAMRADFAKKDERHLKPRLS